MSFSLVSNLRHIFASHCLLFITLPLICLLLYLGPVALGITSWQVTSNCPAIYLSISGPKAHKKDKKKKKKEKEKEKKDKKSKKSKKKKKSKASDGSSDESAEVSDLEWGRVG